MIRLPRIRQQWHEGNELEKDLWGKLPLVRATAYLNYSKGGDVRKVLYELKYYKNSNIGKWLGKCMAQELIPLGFFETVDYIIPVPLHIKREKQRGYNQSLMLAQGIAAKTNIPILSNILTRTTFNETQTHKGLYERWINVQNLFSLLPQDKLNNKHILLIDDVFTTGATIVACADAFSNIKNLRISVLTLAFAR
ncbi:MAG: ComF family protein [Phocaeicola sp.]